MGMHMDVQAHALFGRRRVYVPTQFVCKVLAMCGQCLSRGLHIPSSLIFMQALLIRRRQYYFGMNFLMIMFLDKHDGS